MSNQETELEELKSKLKKIYIRKNKKGTFEIVKRSYTKTTDFQDTQMNAEEKEKFERIYPNTQIGAQEIYFFETKIEGKSKNITKIKFLEKHISLPESRGPDKPFAMDMSNFTTLINDLRKVHSLKTI